jgi:hypothetical protein
MKTILFYLVVIFFSILSTNVFAQDEFYNNKKGAEITSDKLDSLDLNSYTTAEDYYEVGGVVEENNTNEQVDPDNYRDEDTRSEKRRKSEKNEFVSNLVVDVFINAVFIVLTFWQ